MEERLMSDVVLFETRALTDGKQVAVVTLNAPKTLNSLSLEMIDLMLPQLIAWQDDPQIALVLFLSEGDRAFSAGGDIQNLYHDMVEHPGGPCPYCDAFFEREYRLDYLIQTYSKPTVVWGHGIVMGGGLGVMSACSHRVGTETTRIAMPEITIGLFPDAGA
ncbi:MAG: enoyl-CoA hydratase/carnithine racemase, partial [Candidatus Azotimanducaceae bacterium]